MNHYKNILIIKLSSIGDVIHALPVANLLKKNFPAARISWIAEKKICDLLNNNPSIDEIIIFEKSQYKSLKGLINNIPKLIKELRYKNFDLVLDLQGLFKSSLIAIFSGVQHRFVYCDAKEGSYIFSKRIIGQFSHGHIIERYLDVAHFLGCPVEAPAFIINNTVEEEQFIEKLANQNKLILNNKYVVMGIGSNWSNKIWPYQYFAALVDKLYSQNIISVLIGGKEDKNLAVKISKIAKNIPVDLTGQTTLKQLAVVIKKSKVYIGGDTGTMHLAVAVNTPVVALMGPTHPARSGPYGVLNIILSVERECKGCGRRLCPQNVNCLQKISIEKVEAAINLLIDKKI